MNFKTILSVAALALVASVKANPINNTDGIKVACEGDKQAKFLASNGNYTCLRKKEPAELNYRTCFFTDSDVYCVEEQFNNIESCSKNNPDFDYANCAYKITEIIGEGSDKLSVRIRKYPNHEKLFNNYVIDQKECRGHNGIVLTYKEVFQYICLEPTSPKNTISDKQCATVDGKIYCVNQDNTSVDTCVKRSKGYDHDSCNSILKEYGRVNNYSIKGF